MGVYRGRLGDGDSRPVWPGKVMIIYNVIVYNIRTLELSKELVRAVIADAPFSHGLPLRCEFC